MFWCQQITKIINEKTILNEVSVSVEVWEIKAIIGPSWWGKSTLLACLSNMENPTSWTLVMDDISLTFVNDEKKGKQQFPYPKVSLLSQGLFLRPHLSIQENLLLPLKEQKKYHPKPFEEIIQKLHIQDLLSKSPMECSGGERQRVALARSILLKSKYLLLDEITSALDIEHTQIVIDLLQEIKAETGIIVVTHMLHLAKKLSDYVYFMDWGEIKEEWPISILEKPKTKRLKTFLNIF